MEKRTRVRFAPSPTGGLHLGGVRTVLYNYLFAKQQGGDFILRIEDTDRSRFVEGAEQYIYDCLAWCGLEPDESPQQGGAYGPYRQSERKNIYRQYAEQLIATGHAYYAFDTPEELEEMRQKNKTASNPSPQYDHQVRDDMRNSLTMDPGTTREHLDGAARHVIRIKMPADETVTFTDMIRGEIKFETGLVDDKVLLKADGMPTYHLAVVVDDYLMKITHAFRGEEWLPSAPVHLLLWKYLGWEDEMPQWAHLPLILGPSGKLSKRDGAKYGFPVFAMNFNDPKTGELNEGFKEKGFLPEGFVNLLALLGWNDGSEQEIFSLKELVEKFSIDRVHNGGAKFDYEKAKWFNHEWLKKLPPESLNARVEKLLGEKGITIGDHEKLDVIIKLVKDRCSLLTEFYDQSHFFFNAPAQLDVDAVRPKWTAEKKLFFEEYISELDAIPSWESAFIEDSLKALAATKSIKAGELQLPLRVMLVGGKFGPPVFDIAAVLGKEETIRRIKFGMGKF